MTEQNIYIGLYFLRPSRQNKLLLVSLIFVHYMIWEWYYFYITALVQLFLYNCTSAVIFI